MKKLLIIALLIVGCVFGQSNPYHNNFTIEKYQNEACKVVANIDWNKYISDMDVNRRGIPKRTIDFDGNINSGGVHGSSEGTARAIPQRYRIL